MTHKTAIKIVSGFFAAAGLFLIFSPTTLYPEWFVSRLAGLGALIYIALIHSPLLIYKIKKTTPKNATPGQNAAVKRLQTYGALIALLNFAGTCGMFRLYRYGIEYDKLLHFLTPFLLTIATVRFAHHWLSPNLTKNMAYVASMILMIGIAWEFFEYGADKIFGTHSFGQEGNNILKDTALDGIFNGLGIATGLLLLKIRNKNWNY